MSKHKNTSETEAREPQTGKFEAESFVQRAKDQLLNLGNSARFAAGPKSAPMAAAALAGLGVYWLMSRDGSGLPSADIKGKMSGLMENASLGMDGLKENLSHRAQQGSDMIEEVLQNNPLVLGGLVFGFGCALGFLVPESNRENMLLGPAKTQLVENVQASVEAMTDKVKNVAESVTQIAQDTMNLGGGSAS